MHLIMTSLRTGAGGYEYRLDFLGHGLQDGYDDTPLFQTLSTDTDREQLDQIAHMLGIGLALFANTAGYRGLVTLTGPNPESAGQGQRLVSRDEVDDPWNLWSFRINGSANLDGESTRSNTRINGSASASRVTPTWKISLYGTINHNRLDIELEEDDVLDTRTDFSVNPLVVLTVVLVRRLRGTHGSLDAVQSGPEGRNDAGRGVQRVSVRRSDAALVHLLLQDRAPAQPLLRNYLARRRF